MINFDDCAQGSVILAGMREKMGRCSHIKICRLDGDHAWPGMP